MSTNVAFSTNLKGGGDVAGADLLLINKVPFAVIPFLAGRGLIALISLDLVNQVVFSINLNGDGVVVRADLLLINKDIFTSLPRRC